MVLPNNKSECGLTTVSLNVPKPTGMEHRPWFSRRTSSLIFPSIDDDRAGTSLKLSLSGSEHHVHKDTIGLHRNTLSEGLNHDVQKESYKNILCDSNHKESHLSGARHVCNSFYETSELSRREYEIDRKHSSASFISNEAKDNNKVFKTLIVDDSTLSRNMLARLLKSQCGECDEAEDGLKAIEKVQASLECGKPYDIILMDSEMPNMNGPEATKYIKTELGYTGLVIGVTGNALPEDISDFCAHGADDVLVKPIKISQFRRVLDRINGI